jgi:two-component system, chemotaxis family, sensor kinase CheA
MDIEILEEFVGETSELLDEVEPQLIALSQENGSAAADLETLNAIFRLFHTIKGGAGFLDLETVSRVTHEAETLLDIFRKGKAALRSVHTMVLCETIDFLRLLLQAITESGSDNGHEESAGAILARLHGLISEIQEGSTRVTDSTLSQPEAAAKITVSLDELPVITITAAMRTSYVQEAEDALDLAEQSLLAVERKEGEAGEHLAAALRAIHSIKGNSGFIGFADLERIAHRMENVLAAMRGQTVPADSRNLNVLCDILDILRGTIGEITRGGTGEIIELSKCLTLLDGIEVGEDKGETPGGGPVTANADGEAAGPDRTQVGADGGSSFEPPSVEKGGREAKCHPPPGGKKPVVANQLSSAGVRQDIRVDLQKLDAMINLVGELVIAESMVTRHPHVAGAEIESLDRATHLLRRVSRDLQDVVMSARMIPLAGTFRKMIRLVHDLSTKTGKQINLKLVGEETEVDKTVIEQIADPLVHIMRNAADHGIETPEQRNASGKSPQATITLEGRHEGGEVWVLISDDGRGLNRERILGKARENGLVGDEAQDWPDERVFRLIFEPGFSTAEAITNVSGRGVGMDVVKKNIEKLKGKIDIRSRLGLGSTFILRIPLTLAIIDGMLVRVGSARYTIPILAIRESFRPDHNWINVTPDGQETVRIRDDFYPILRLHERFGKTPDSCNFEDGILVLVECDRRIVALFVDEIVGQQETVIKGLSSFLRNSSGVSGCTILGDGEVSLILDVAGLVEGQGREDKKKYT